LTSFEITAGNPNTSTFPITLQFDIPPTNPANSLGALIDNVILLPVEIVELAPLVMDEDGNAVANSEKPARGLPLTPFVEINPVQDRIAYRELKIRIGTGELSGKTVTWSMVSVPNGPPANFRAAP
jgi:hypothetical protein